MSIGTFEVRDPKIEAALREIGHQIGDKVPPGYGFTLMLFQFGDEGDNLFYISNACRESMIAAMREFIRKNAEN